MHKKYIEPSLPIVVDYIPEDFQVCARCLFFEVCPYDYTCNTFNRVQEYENMVNDHSDQRSDEA